MRGNQVRRRPRKLPQGTAIAVSMGVMNVTTYGFTIIAARLLGPRDFGAFAALMGVLLVIMVVSLALQATAARRIAAAPDEVHQIEAMILRVGFRAAVGVGVRVPGAVSAHRPDGASRRSAHRRAHRLRGGPAHLDGRPGRDPAGRAPVDPALDDLPLRRRAPAPDRHGGDPAGTPRSSRPCSGSPSRRGSPCSWGGSRCATHGSTACTPPSTAPGRCGGRPSATRTPCWRSSPSPTSISWWPATSWRSARQGCTPAA